MISFFEHYGRAISQIFLIMVGTLVLIVYWLQERKKRIEAASLIILQIDELCNRMREVATYIVGGQLNATSFYESLPLLDENYWNRYKHYFVRDMDSESFTSINTFYDYVSEIQEQQLLVKRLQKKHFELTQSAVIDIESRLIADYFNNQDSLISDKATTPSIETDSFLSMFKPKRMTLINLINMDVLIPYTPQQIANSLEKILKSYSMLTVVGTTGYQKLKGISKRRF